MTGRELAGFFDLVEQVGCVRVPAATLAGSVPAAAVAALRAERVLEEGSPAEALPCAHRAGCTREVREVGGRWLATCGQAPPECDDEWLARDDVRTLVIRLASLTRLIARHFGVRRAREELPQGTPGWGAPGEPRLLGTQERAALEGAVRDVFLSLRPRVEVTDAWLALRERAARAALVIVPTMKRLGPELPARHGPMDRVEILALDDALTVREGIVTAGLRGAGMSAMRAERAGNDTSGAKQAAAGAQVATGKKKKSEPLRKTRGLALPPIAKWRDLRVCLLDGDTVRLDGGGKYARFTASELGLVWTSTHKPTRAWEVLAMTCEHGGLLDYKKFDSRWDVVRRHVSDLGKRMQALFGVHEPPFEEPRDGVYRAKFVARVGVPGEIEV
ncbi:MAG: hypothetical protein ACLQVI_03625 [Polyangiaceae bacterium]